LYSSNVTVTSLFFIFTLMLALLGFPRHRHQLFLQLVWVCRASVNTDVAIWWGSSRSTATTTVLVWEWLDLRRSPELSFFNWCLILWLCGWDLDGQVLSLVTNGVHFPGARAKVLVLRSALVRSSIVASWWVWHLTHFSTVRWNVLIDDIRAKQVLTCEVTHQRADLLSKVASMILALLKLSHQTIAFE